MKILEQQEKQLHTYEVRNNNSLVKKLLHSSFIEIGYSGNTYDYKSTIQSLSREEKPDYTLHSQDYEYQKLTSELVQVLYKTAHLLENGGYCRFAKRMSLWILENDNWKMKYHQGTPTEKFKIR